MTRISRLRLALTLLGIFSLPTFGAPRALAQYIYLDTNGDGANTSADVVNPAGSTDLDIWIVTNAGRDGTPALCSSQDGDLSISAYELILHATNGTLHWTSFVNRRPEFGVSLGEASSATDYRNGQGAGGSLAPGTYHLATVTVDVASGTPSVAFATTTPLGGGYATSFASSCSGLDFDNTLKYGSDWLDADGVAYGGASNQSPQLGPIADMIVPEGSLGFQTITADDPDGNPLTFEIASVPNFASVATLDYGSGHATGQIIVAPTFSDAGEYSASVAASDGLSSARATFAINVTPTNRRPMLAQPLDIATTEGIPASTPLNAEDPDQDLLTFSLVSGPPFVTVTTLERVPRAIGRLDAAPHFTDAGEYAAIVAVTDGDMSDSKSITIRVSEAFNFVEPILLAPVDMVVTAGEVPVQTLHGRSADGGEVVFSKTGGPAFMEVTTTGPSPDGTLGMVRLTPGTGDVGVFDASVRANGTVGHGEAPFRILVIAKGDPPPVAPLDFATGLTSIALENFPQDSAIGDLDGDGVPDLVGVNHFDASLTLAFGRGDGSFPRRQIYRVGGRPISAAIADLDHDGRNDIAFVDLFGDVVSVLHGNGAGLFGHRSDYSTGRAPAYVEAADLNDDAIPDLVVANEDDNTVSVFISLHGGGFAPRVDYPVGAAPCQLSVGDLNHDARPDVVVVNEDENSLSVLLNVGLGTLGPHATFETGQQPRTVEIADFNLDGQPDLAVPNFSSYTFSVLLGHGDGSFGTRSDSPTGLLPWGLAVADFNRDGHPDVSIVEIGMGRASIYLGDGAGGFATPTHFTVGSTPRTVRSGDLNLDGKADLVSCNESGDNLAILLGNGDGTFGGAEPATTPGLLRDPKAGRVDEDAYPDLVVADPAGGIRILFRDGHGGTVRDLPIGEGIQVSEFVQGDWNGDGKTDFAWTNSANQLVVVLNLGGRTFGPPAIDNIGASLYGLVSADWDGDGHADLAAEDPQGARVYVYHGRGDGTFALAETRDFAGEVRSLAQTDWNADGVADLAVGVFAGGGQIEFLLGAQGAPLTPGPTATIRLTPTGIAFDDLDRDGSPEMLVSGAVDFTGGFTATLSVFHRGAGAVPELGFERSLGRDAIGVETADLNGDGFPDAISSDSFHRTFFIFPGSRNGVLGSRIDAGAGFSLPAVLDWDGDGAPDLISNDVEQLFVFRNRIPHTPKALAARAFTTAENRVTRLKAGRPSTCVEVEPLAQSFPIQEVDPASITMRSTGTGDVEEIASVAGKEMALGDRDKNGVQELSACFPRESLERLFSHLTGISTVLVTVRGALVNGARFEAALDLTVVAGGGPPKVTVAPNPMNPTATMTVVTESAGPLRVRLFDASGRLVRTLMDSRIAPAGEHALPIEAMPRGGPRLASGIYFFRVEAVGGSETGRIAVVK